MPGAVRQNIRGSTKSFVLFCLPSEVGAEVPRGRKGLPGQQTCVRGWSWQQRSRALGAGGWSGRSCYSHYPPSRLANSWRRAWQKPPRRSSGHWLYCCTQGTAAETPHICFQWLKTVAFLIKWKAVLSHREDRATRPFIKRVRLSVSPNCSRWRCQQPGTLSPRALPASCPSLNTHSSPPLPCTFPSENKFLLKINPEKAIRKK